MAKSCKNQINLKTLQRVDCNIIEIIDNACQVAIYKYESKLGKWEGTDIEGALFLYRRSVHPHHGFIIVNRMSTTNFNESITSDMQFQLQEPYFLYKNHAGEIIGSWFYEQKDLQRISKKIQRIVLKEASPPKRQRCASESETLPQTVDSRDIMILLSEAHEQYIKKANSPKSPLKSYRDTNNLNKTSEKKCLEKSTYSSELSKNSIKTKSTCEVNCVLSPRRRYMSTGSFDVQQRGSMSSVRQKCNFNSDAMKGDLDSNLIDPKSTHGYLMLQHSSPDEDASLSKERFYPYLQENVLKNDFSPNFTQSDQNRKSIINLDSTVHIMSIKDAIKFHIEENPKVMLKIHEAYVSSLKSIFTKNSC